MYHFRKRVLQNVFVLYLDSALRLCSPSVTLNLGDSRLKKISDPAFIVFDDS